MAGTQEGAGKALSTLVGKSRPPPCPGKLTRGFAGAGWVAPHLTLALAWKVDVDLGSGLAPAALGRPSGWHP